MSAGMAELGIPDATERIYRDRYGPAEVTPHIVPLHRMAKTLRKAGAYECDHHPVAGGPSPAA